MSLTGSSAIQNICNDMQATPQIRVHLGDNIQWGNTTYDIYDSHLYCADTHPAIIFNNRAVVYLNDIATGYRIYSFPNVDRLGSTTGTTSYLVTTSIVRPKFYTNGNTLEFIYTLRTGNTNYIYQLSSGDGMGWGGSQLVYRDSGNSWYIADAAKTSATQMYVLYLAGSSVTKDIIKSVQHNGSSWLGVTLSSLHASGQELFATHNNDIDLLTYRARNTPTYSPSGNNFLRTTQTDGINILGSYTIDDNTPDDSTKIMTIAKGLSYYHSLMAVDTAMYIFANGMTQKVSSTHDYFYAKSNDGYTWNNAIRVPLNLTEGTIWESAYLMCDITNDNMVRIIFGVSSEEYVAKYITCESGSSITDLSTYVASYSNRNNDRISLSLSNYS